MAGMKTAKLNTSEKIYLSDLCKYKYKYKYQYKYKYKYKNKYKVYL